MVMDSWGQLPILLLEVSDRFVWSVDPSGLFSVAFAWHWKARVDWSSFIWNKTITPMYQFNLWLIIKNRLPTQAFLMSYGRIGREVCAFCKLTLDSIDHLFFGCGKDFYHAIGRFSFAALCHLIWRYRNDILFRGHPVVPVVVKKHLIKVVKDKALTFRSVEDCPRNRRLQRNWGLNPSIFSSPTPTA
ncbi:uncharacterized protein LOC120296053 [Eucalyptus grandis]|uniref:uncharacterized protein LOC120296053 n=1 Tax=Eucalyptus grandis TaxID=71139 RepID=UPI00192F0950|nr:uncharacterized protein LOC120296053 [Eucalyptus grandis]